MKALILAATAIGVATSAPAAAENYDFIAYKMRPGCSVESFMNTVTEFNKYIAPWGYQTTILMPRFSSSWDTWYWMGRTKDAATTNAAITRWNNALKDPNSTESKLMARFNACNEQISRSNYDAL